MFFDRLVAFVMKELQSFFSGEPAFAADREIEESVPVTGRMEWMPALARGSKVDLRLG
jgi:hypothetical protein